MQRRLITVNIHGDAIPLFVSTYFYHVFKMSAFITYSCFEWCIPLAIGCVDLRCSMLC